MGYLYNFQLYKYDSWLKSDSGFVNSLNFTIADALRIVNILMSAIFDGRFAERLAVNKAMADKHWWKRRGEEGEKISDFEQIY